MSPNPPDLSTSFISSTFRLKHREVEKNQAPEQCWIFIKESIIIFILKIYEDLTVVDLFVLI